MLTTTQAAEKLGITPRRIVALIEDGRLSAAKVSGRYQIDRRALKAVGERKPGRPRKLAKGAGQ